MGVDICVCEFFLSVLCLKEDMHVNVVSDSHILFQISPLAGLGSTSMLKGYKHHVLGLVPH
jgi:hypothetical protein